jgi:hypothetical protein
VNDYGLILNPATAANPPPGAEALVDRARARVADILGPPVPGGRPVHKRGAAGACHVCGETGPLTFEHMPPKSASNSHPRRAVDVETSLAHPISEFPTRGWVSMQRGVGLYATCAKCNNFGGAAYVPNYFDFTASVIIGLEQWARQAERAGETDVPDKIRMNLQRIHPGSIVRQVLFMLLTASGSEGLGARYPVLGEIVLDQVTASLPPEMALRLTLLPANQRSRLHHVATEANFDTGRERALVEVAFTPFAWLLEIGDPSDREAFDIAGWTEVPPDEQRQVELVTTIGSIVTAIGGDYRHRWEIPDEELTEADQDAVAAQRQRKGGSSACHAVGRRHLRDSIGRQTRQRTGDASGSRP